MAHWDAGLVQHHSSFVGDFIIPCVYYLGYSSFTVDGNTTTNSSLVTFSLGIAVATFTSVALAIISLPVGFYFVLFMDSVITYYLIEVVLILF